MKKLYLSLLILLTVSSIFAQDRAFKLQRQETKDHVALIIGNSNYPDMPLANPKNDVSDVAAAFEDMGFIVEKVFLDRKKAEEDAIMAKKQNDIDALEKQIQELKKKTGSDETSDGDLDKMLAIVRERENRKKELEGLRKKAEEDRMAREKEIAALKKKDREEKKAKLSQDLGKFNEIAKSEFGQDMKESAWNSILKKWGLPARSIAIGDESGLRAKILDIYFVFTDMRDGKTYKAVVIGEQVSMAQNLNYNTGSRWCYDNNSSNASQYGRLYTWEEAKNICPQGSHLPSKEEFETLINNCGGSAEAAYKALLPGGSSGFSAPFGGYRYGNGPFGRVGENAYFWSSSPDSEEGAWYLVVSSYG
jgi:uncharacterized protein (TIGR02145 family)